MTTPLDLLFVQYVKTGEPARKAAAAYFFQKGILTEHDPYFPRFGYGPDELRSYPINKQVSAALDTAYQTMLEKSRGIFNVELSDIKSPEGIRGNGR